MIDVSKKVDTLVFDLDGVICKEEPQNWKHYYSVVPNIDIIYKLNVLSKRGYKIVIHTSRLEEDRDITVNWLRRYGVNYNELRFNKPKGLIYVDDKSVRPDEFINLELGETDVSITD